MKGPVLLSSFLLYPMSSGHGISLIVNIIDPRPSLTDATFKVNSIHQARNDPVDSSVKHLWRMVFFPAVERRNLLRWLSNSACCLYVCIDVPGILWPQVKLIGSMLCQRVHDANVFEGYCSFLSVRSCMPSDFTDSSIPPVLSFDNLFFNVVFRGKKKLSSHVWNLMKIRYICLKKENSYTRTTKKTNSNNYINMSWPLENQETCVLKNYVSYVFLNTTNMKIKTYLKE